MSIASIEDVKKAIAAATEDPIMLTVFTWILEFKKILEEQKERDRAIMFALAEVLMDGHYSHALDMLRKVYEEQYQAPLPTPIMNTLVSATIPLEELEPFSDIEVQRDLGSLLHMIFTFRRVVGFTLDTALDNALDEFLSVGSAGHRLAARSRYTREYWKSMATEAYSKWQGETDANQ
jgi:hypothetical protein